VPQRVAATGARILTTVDFKANRFNLFIVAISVGFGMIPLMAPDFFANLPAQVRPLTDSGILLCAIVSVVLSQFFNGFGSAADARSGAAAAAASAEHVLSIPVINLAHPSPAGLTRGGHLFHMSPSGLRSILGSSPGTA
jgi:hypothetical protein